MCKSVADDPSGYADDTHKFRVVSFALSLSPSLSLSACCLFAKSNIILKNDGLGCKKDILRWER